MLKIYRISLLCIVFLLGGGLGSMLFAQQHTITGTVQDDSGNALPGVAIIIQGTQTGTTSDGSGAFRLSIPEGAVILEARYIGYYTQEIPVGPTQTFVAIVMREEVEEVEQVVVTAYATQKKINVTGAISSVSGDAILASPVGIISNALIGNTPGISGLQTSGEPGQNETDLRIRGISTYQGSSAPLVVIDGVEQASEQAFVELNNMDANEIASISILKDASSTAVYGIRGANGVILVTTKRGSIGRPQINFSYNYGLTMASDLQKGTTSYEWALMRNEAVRNEQRSFSGMSMYDSYIYSDYDLWKFKNNRDFTPREVAALNLPDSEKIKLLNSPALYYTSNDLYKQMFDKIAPQMQANINISGGTETVKYFTSFGYFSQEGIINSENYYGANTNSKFDRYNFRLNFDIQIAKRWKLMVNTAGQFGQNRGPGGTDNPYDLSDRYKRIMQYIYDGNPFLAPGFVDGKLVNGFAGDGNSMQGQLAEKTHSSIGNQSPVYSLLTSSTGRIYNSLLDNVVKLEHDMDYLTPNLRIFGTLSYQDNYNRRVRYYPSMPVYTVERNEQNPNLYDFYGGGMSSADFSSWGYSNWNKLYMDAGADWSGSYNNHNLSALLLAKVSKYTLPWDDFNVPSGLIGYVGRITYNYDNRYMAEFNAGYNGTEQFAKGSRFGFFPAVSVGWVPTAESFFPQNKYVTFIKIRGSYGEVGNDNIGGRRRYYYLANTYSYDDYGYYFGSSNGSSKNPLTPGAYEGTIGNSNIKWERAKKYDVGLEARFFSDRLSFVFDWFKEDRDNILTYVATQQSVSGIPDSSNAPVNVGKTRNQGYEIELDWSDKIGDFGYSIGGDISYSRNKIVYRAEAQTDYYWMRQTGFAIGQRFGYISDGFFNTEEELANRPYYSFNSDRVTLGDLKFKDLNGDGIIDYKDQAPIGYPNYPQYHYAVKARFSYKGFDLRVLFNGTANGSYEISSGMRRMYEKNAGNIWKWMYDGRWTPEKYAAGDKITFPRAAIHETQDNSHINNQSSDFWMVSNNFFKLKNIELGYSWTNKKKDAKEYGVKSFRVYVNANNLVTFSNSTLKDIGIDPEIKDGSTYIYPLTRIINMGISLQF